MCRPLGLPTWSYWEEILCGPPPSPHPPPLAVRAPGALVRAHLQGWLGQYTVQEPGREVCEVTSGQKPASQGDGSGPSILHRVQGPVRVAPGLSLLGCSTRLPHLWIHCLLQEAFPDPTFLCLPVTLPAFRWGSIFSTQDTPQVLDP